MIASAVCTVLARDRRTPILARRGGYSTHTSRAKRTLRDTRTLILARRGGFGIWRDEGE